MKSMPRYATSVLSTALVFASSTALAETPLGWISSEQPSAYTQNARSIELTVSGLAVNENIDFLNIRDDMLAGTRKLEGDSGDLSGGRLELHVGILESLSAFYRRQEQSLTIEIGTINSVELVSLDDSLDTTSTAYGLKWNFFESGYFDKSRAWGAASLEIARVQNKSENFAGVAKRISLGSDLTVTFVDPQEFRLENLEDEGWEARLLYSRPFSERLSSSFWVGYTETDATSGTNSDMPIPTLKQAFEQSFETEENRLLLGAGLNWLITPRMPLQLSYEYLRTNKSDTVVQTNPLNSLLPSFLRAGNLATSDSGDNHTLSGSLSYWVTPVVNVSLTGKLFSNQFLGVIPHFNNPLSASFSDKPYGYAGIRIGVSL